MTDENKPKDEKPGFKGSNPKGNETPEELLQARIDLANAQRAAADEKRRADELERRLKAAGQQPAQTPQQPKPQREKTAWHFDFEIKSALKWTALLGAAGLATYTATKLGDPTKKLFMMGPNFLRDNMQGMKGSASALVLAAAQVLGIGGGGVAAYDTVKDATEYSNSNLTMTSRFGALGFIANQFIRSSADSQDTSRRQPFFEALGNNTINGATEVAHEARDQLAKLDETRGEAPSRASLLRHSFVQICTPQVTDAQGNWGPEATEARDNGTIARHFDRVNGIVDAMKADPASKLNRALLEEHGHAQVIVSPYNAATNVEVVAMPMVNNIHRIQCPQNHLGMNFSAEEWLSRPGLRPRDLDPK